MAKRQNLRKKSFNFVPALAQDLEDISAEIGVTETTLIVFSLRAYIAAYKEEQKKVTSTTSASSNT
jgi:hypothetical protein